MFAMESEPARAFDGMWDRGRDIHRDFLLAVASSGHARSEHLAFSGCIEIRKGHLRSLLLWVVLLEELRDPL